MNIRASIRRLLGPALLLPLGLGVVPASSGDEAESPRPASAGRMAGWRSEIRSTLHVPDPLPALEPEFLGRFEPAPGVLAERITYATEFGMRVPATVYLPKETRGKAPALIVVNGHGGDKYTWYSFYTGILYARAGAAVLTYDPAGEGERNAQRRSGARAHDRDQEPLGPMARRLSGLMIGDVMQAVSYLSARPEVDPSRIAAMGYSMGSFVVALAGAVDARLRACVLVGGGNLDGPEGYWDTSSKRMCQGVPYRSLAFLGDRPAALFALHAARGPTLIYNGLGDTVVAIPSHREPFFADLRDRTSRLRGSPEGLFEVGFHPDGSHRPYWVTRPVALWLERTLDFPSWTASDIEAMPETHVSEWSKARDVALDPGYSNEEREGGTRALGTGVPGFTRDDVSAFTPEEWERRKDALIYDRWVEHAKAAVAAEPGP